MQTIQIELPEDLATYWARIPEAERNAFAVAALRDAVEDNIAEEDLPPLTEEDLAAIGRGLADADAGRLIDADIVHKEALRRVGL